MSDTLVNSYTTGLQGKSTVTALADGGWVVTWNASGADGDPYDIYQQRYNADGTTNGGETLVNSYTANSQDAPVVAALDDGGWVVGWMSNGIDTWNYGIEFQRYSSSGAEAGSETQANVYFSDNQLDPSITTLANGNFVVTWTSYNNEDGDGTGVYQRVFNASGAAVGSETQVNSYTTSDQQRADVTGLADGGWVVTWSSSGEDGSGAGIYQQQYDSDGSVHGGETVVNAYTTSSQTDPVVTALSDGGWLVTWVSSGQDGSYDGIYQRRYDDSGVAAASEILVNTSTSGFQSTPDVTVLEGGGWVVVWTSPSTSGGSEVYVQQYDADGGAVGNERRINSYTAGDQNEPSVTALADGGFVVTWTSAGQDGSDGGVYQKRYDADGIVYGHVNKPVAIDSTASGSEDMDSYFASGQFGFSDGDGDALYSIVITSLPSNGELSFNGDPVTEGLVIPAGDIWKLVYRADTDQNGDPFDSFKFKVTDDSGAASDNEATMTIDIAAISDPPDAVDDVAVMTEGQRLVADVLENDTDGDGDTLSVSSARIESGKGEVKVRGGGSLVVVYSGRDLDPGEQATLSVAYRVTDGHTSDKGRLTVTVTGVAEPGDDILGTADADTLGGTNASERILGYAGNDSLDGKRGRDVLNGGTGDDMLKGGGDRDAFVFTGLSGKDTIEDFNAAGAAGDVVNLAGIASIRNYTDLVRHHLSQVSGDAVITIDADNSITLDGVHMRDLGKDDFLF